MTKKILVTGGAGFVGSHLCERLAKDNNNEVYSLDGRVHDEWSQRNPTNGFDKTFPKGKDSAKLYGLGDGGSNYSDHNGNMLIIFLKVHSTRAQYICNKNNSLYIYYLK